MDVLLYAGVSVVEGEVQLKGASHYQLRSCQ